MLMLQLLPWVVLLADATGDGWQQAARDDGITVYKREKPGGVHEMKAIGMIGAPPSEVWKAIRDYPSYDRTMPYTEESQVLGTEDGGRVIYFYSVVNAPVV